MQLKYKGNEKVLNLSICNADAITCLTTGSLGAGEVLRELLEGRLLHHIISPKIGSHVGGGVGNGGEGSLDEVTEGLSLTTGSSVAVLDTSELEELLDGLRGDDAGTTGSRNETAEGRTTLTGDLGGDGVGSTDDVAPIAKTDGDEGKLGKSHSTLDGSRDFLAALNTETDVTNIVTNDDEGLEAGTLTGLGLLLHGHHLDDLFVQLGEEVVDDLELLDGHGEAVNLVHGLNLAILDETAELGARNPFLVLVLATAHTATTTATSTTTAATTATRATTSTTRSLISHCYDTKKDGLDQE